MNQQSKFVEAQYPVTPSMEQDFADWRRNSKPEDMAWREEWIAAMKKALITNE